MSEERRQIAVLLFEGFNAQDVVGPYEVLRFLPATDLVMVAKERGPLRTERGSLTLLPERTLGEVERPQIVVVPGGAGEERVRKDPATLAWLQQVHATSVWTVSVCTGALVLGAAEILRGKRATTHWAALGELAQFGATAVDERYVFDGKVVSSAGVSAGIDMSLALAARIAGNEVAQAIQLGIEYDPQPPFNSGSTAKAAPELVARLRAASRFTKKSKGM